jgi:hypothetical protein
MYVTSSNNTKWCKDSYPNINLRKTIVIPFTRKCKLNLVEPGMSGVTVEFSKATKYLGVVLDSTLLWNFRVKRVIEKAYKALMAFRSVIGQRWGLKPGMMKWIYTLVLRPMVTYAFFV